MTGSLLKILVVHNRLDFFERNLHLWYSLRIALMMNEMQKGWKNMWQTRMAEQIGLKFPIIQAPMAGGATTPELVAAVSNAGGLGSLGAGYMNPPELRSALKAIRELTNKPFAVNLFIPGKYHATTAQIQESCNDIEQSCAELKIRVEALAEPYAPSFEEQINILIEEKIPVFSYAFGLLDAEWIAQFKKTIPF